MATRATLAADGAQVEIGLMNSDGCALHELGHGEGRPHAGSTPEDGVAPAGKPGLRGIGGETAKLAAALWSMATSSGFDDDESRDARVEARIETEWCAGAPFGNRRRCAGRDRPRSEGACPGGWRSSRGKIRDEGIESLFETRLLDRDQSVR